MEIEVALEPITALVDYARISCAFQVQHVLELPDGTDAPLPRMLSVRPVSVPFVKDYDSIPGESPLDWPRRWDMSNWALFAARVEGQRVGGAAIAFNMPNMIMLEELTDVAVLWDIRVSPGARGRGVAGALFRAAETWAAERGCRHLIVETQDINVPACRFYARHGCILQAMNRSACPNLPDELQLLWHKNLSPELTSPRSNKGRTQ